jgi:hypothetical protein
MSHFQVAIACWAGLFILAVMVIDNAERWIGGLFLIGRRLPVVNIAILFVVLSAGTVLGIAFGWQLWKVG